jgi:hypothetical protein
MSCISIQKKPTLWGELLMVFINNSYEYESYHSKAPMVRLKLISKQKTISIPYGAIKRSLVDIIALGIIAFQSLMVRLFLQRYKNIFIKQIAFKCFFYKLIDKNKLYVCKYC